MEEARTLPFGAVWDEYLPPAERAGRRGVADRVEEIRARRAGGAGLRGRRFDVNCQALYDPRHFMTGRVPMRADTAERARPGSPFRSIKLPAQQVQTKHMIRAGDATLINIQSSMPWSKGRQPTSRNVRAEQTRADQEQRQGQAQRGDARIARPAAGPARRGREHHHRQPPAPRPARRVPPSSSGGGTYSRGSGVRADTTAGSFHARARRTGRA